MFPAKIRDLQPSLLFLQDPYDLLFRKATAFHPSVSFSIGLYFKMGTFSGGASFRLNCWNDTKQSFTDAVDFRIGAGQ
ncbi:hypothetical protein SXCC_02004 [Gluconacetobacter sp. SXCC-1]|nr:hypothetical protein SXCC_02004 [Gluconacetobacter sp. SXCC-1]